MKIHFLPSAIDDLSWMKEYYETVFPAGKDNAGAHFEATLSRLRENPSIGVVIESVPTLRKFGIKRTPFSLVYKIHENDIWIVRVQDQRSMKHYNLK